MLSHDGDTVFTSFLIVKQLIMEVFQLIVVSSLEKWYPHLSDQRMSFTPDVNEIVFSFDSAASQFKNRYRLQHLTMIMDINDLEISWNYFASSHGKGVVDGVGGTLKRLVWMEIMTGARCSSAQEFVDICHRKQTATVVGFVQQAQFDATKVSLERTFQTIPGIPGIQRQHHITVLLMNVIEYARYSSSEHKYVFRF